MSTLLEAVQAQEIPGHVAGNGHHRHGIHIGCGDACHQVGGAGAGGGDAHPYPAGSPGITVCRMGRGLLVGRFNMADFVAVLIEGVINIQHCPAGVAEHGIYALLQQAFHDNIRTVALHNENSFLKLLPRNKKAFVPGLTDQRRRPEIRCSPRYHSACRLSGLSRHPTMPAPITAGQPGQPTSKVSASCSGAISCRRRTASHHPAAL